MYDDCNRKKSLLKALFLLRKIKWYDKILFDRKRKSEVMEVKLLAQWKDVVGYEGLYLISDEGEVVSLPRVVNTRNKYGDVVVHRKEKFLKPHLRGKNNVMYVAVTLSNNGKSRAYSVHRLVAEAFIPNPDNLPEVNHIDENPLNNRVENLEWCTRQYNIEYSKSKRVSQYKDGEKIAEYKSIKFASEITGISRSQINNALCGWSKTAGGFEWRYEGSDDL